VTGQVEQLAVKQSPDPRIEGPLIEALKNWTFQSSQVDGKPVALKVLMGISFDIALKPCRLISLLMMNARAYHGQ
jgi:hypothetical protein